MATKYKLIYFSENTFNKASKVPRFVTMILLLFLPSIIYVHAFPTLFPIFHITFTFPAPKLQKFNNGSFSFLFFLNLLGSNCGLHAKTQNIESQTSFHYSCACQNGTNSLVNWEGVLILKGGFHFGNFQSPKRKEDSIGH